MFDRFRKKDKNVSSASSPEGELGEKHEGNYSDNGIMDELGKREGNITTDTDTNNRDFMDVSSEDVPEQQYNKENLQDSVSSSERENLQTGQSSYADVDPSAATSQLGDEIGIRALMDQRAKLQESLDYIGMMIRSLKDKRTGLEKEVEDEWVDIKKLKEQLQKVSEYIEDETRGLRSLIQKRTQVEKDANEVANLVESLRGKIASIDDVVNQEGNRIKSFKESHNNTSVQNDYSSNGSSI